MGFDKFLPPHMRDKVDPRDVHLLGKAGMGPAEVLDANATKAEKVDHNRLLGFLARNELKRIHAPTFRRVHDLPPGWPDFTIFHGTQHLFIELKACGGRLSPVQKTVKAELEAQGAKVHIRYSYEAARNLIITWLWEIARWTPKDPE